MPTSAEQLKALAAIPQPQSMWVVDRLIRIGSPRPNLLAGYPHAGKSTLARQLALAVAHGIPWLGRNTTQGHVIYWTQEERSHSISYALDRAGLQTTSDLEVITSDENPDHFAALETALRATPTLLVVIEMLDAFIGEGDLNEAKDINRALDTFRKKISDLFPHTTFVALVHYSKSNHPRRIMRIGGSMKIAGHADTIIHVDRLTDEDLRRLVATDVRDDAEPIEPSFLIFDPVTHLSTLGGLVSEEKATQRAEQRERDEFKWQSAIDALLQATPGINKGDLADGVTGAARKTKLAYIERMIAEGMYREEQAGKAKHIYWVGVTDAEGNPSPDVDAEPDEHADVDVPPSEILEYIDNVNRASVENRR